MVLQAFIISTPSYASHRDQFLTDAHRLALGNVLLLLGSWPALITMVIYPQSDLKKFFFFFLLSALIYYRSWIPVNVVFTVLQLILSFCKLACILFAYLQCSRNRPIIFPKLKW